MIEMLYMLEFHWKGPKINRDNKKEIVFVYSSSRCMLLQIDKPIREQMAARRSGEASTW